MKARIDATKCSGYGACADLCPSLFKIDEFGFAQILGDGVVPPDAEDAAKAAARACPDHAIVLAEDASK